MIYHISQTTNYLNYKHHLELFLLIARYANSKVILDSNPRKRSLTGLLVAAQSLVVESISSSFKMSPFLHPTFCIFNFLFPVLCLMFCNFSSVASGLVLLWRKCFPSRVAGVHLHINIFNWWIWYATAVPLIFYCQGLEWCHNGGTPTLGKTSQSTAESNKH